MRDDVRTSGGKDTLTVQRAAVVLNVHEDTIHRLIKARKLVAFKVGHQWRILRSDLLDYREKNLN